VVSRLGPMESAGVEHPNLFFVDFATRPVTYRNQSKLRSEPWKPCSEVSHGVTCFNRKEIPIKLSNLWVSTTWFVLLTDLAWTFPTARAAHAGYGCFALGRLVAQVLKELALVASYTEYEDLNTTNPQRSTSTQSPKYLFKNLREQLVTFWCLKVASKHSSACGSIYFRPEPCAFFMV